MELVTEEVQMDLRDMAQSPKERDNGQRSESGVQPLPPQGCSPSDPWAISSSQAELFCYKAPREAVSAAAGVRPLSPMQGLTQQIPL